MVRRVLGVFVIFGCLLAVSCSSIFDSYFPQTVEYLETQTSLSSAVGGQTVVSILMGYLPATAAHSSDLLVVVAATQDGNSHVLFYDPNNLSLKKSYSSSDLNGINGGTAPVLNLIAQDGTALYTGAVSYNPQSLGLGVATDLPSALSGDSTNLTAFRETYDGTNAVLSGPNGSGVSYGTATTYNSITALSTTLSGISSQNNASVLDSIFLAGTYYFVVASGSSVDLTEGSNLAAMPVTTVSPGQSSGSGGGWATSTAAVFLIQSNNAYTLTAYSWSGASLASIQLSQTNRQTVALAFAPNGSSWYLFDSTTGKLSRNRPWW
jgi:hypothetical protein